MFVLMMNYENNQQKDKFEAIYNAYKNNMFYICKRYLKNNCDAEDALQTAFLKISRIMDTIEDIYSNRAKHLFGTIVRNTAIDFYRQKQRIPLPMEEAVEKVNYLSAEDSMIDRNNYEALIRTIDSMPEKYRDVLRLRCLYHYSASETAKLLDITENNVNARMFRAKNMLLSKLEGGAHE